jgi:hypothetical protein
VVDYYLIDYELMVELIYLDVEHDHHYFDLLSDNYVEEFLVEHLTLVMLVVVLKK